MPKYSVIMPTYNRALFLRRSVQSVLGQDCMKPGDIELIVVDDGSTDETPEVMKAFLASEKRQVVRSFRVNHIGEPGTVRNIALEQASGDFIAYCDSDDYWLPHHLATAGMCFGKNPGLGMVSNYWGFAYFRIENGQIRTKIIVPPHPTWAVNTNCRVHRRECVAKVGLFNTSKWGEDGDFFGRIESAFPCEKTGIVSSVNGYIQKGNNLTFQFDPGVKAMYY